MMDILICLNENYLMPSEVMLYSLFQNNKNITVTVHAMVPDVGDYVLDLKNFVEEHGQRIFIYDMSKVALPIIPSHSNNKTSYPLEAYYRLFVTEVIPHDIHKVLYLDGDIIVRGGLSELWNTDVTGYAVAAGLSRYNDDIKLIKKLGFDPKYGYFNSGVLLINLDYWRENQVVNLFVNYIKNNMDNLRFADQDVLNPVFCDKRLELSIRYNFCTTFLLNDRFRMIASKSIIEEIDKWCKKPCVIHYNSADKPWNSDSLNIHRKIWRKYRDETKWRDYIVKKDGPSFKEKILRAISCLKHGVTSYTFVRYNKKYQLNEGNS